MTVIRTSLNLRPRDATRLTRGGYDIQHIETRRDDASEESWIVWTRPARADDILESEIPY